MTFVGPAYDDPAFDDSPIDPDLVAAGAWDVPRYGSGDTLGSYNEVTPEARARAWASIDPSRPVATYSLGETLTNGYPAWGTRAYHQHLVVSGYTPPPGYTGEVLRPEPFSRSRMVSFEERVTATYNMASKINGLLHVACANVAYGGRRVPELVASHGVTDLGVDTWGPPLLTRGFVVDVLALKVAQGATDALDDDGAGTAILRGDYRITMDDLAASIERQQLPAFEPGDAVLLRTGWVRTARTDGDRYLAVSPGPHLRETRWLAAHRLSIIGIDAWHFGVTDRAYTAGYVGSCHIELSVHHGIRFGEGLWLEDVAAAGVDRFVLCHNPLNAVGAVSSSSPITAIANPSA
ncbi:MAG: cyclase family protein [Acidimicrobiia bacterium]